MKAPDAADLPRAIENRHGDWRSFCYFLGPQGISENIPRKDSRESSGADQREIRRHCLLRLQKRSPEFNELFWCADSRVCCLAWSVEDAIAVGLFPAKDLHRFHQRGAVRG